MILNLCLVLARQQLFTPELAPSFSPRGAQALGAAVSSKLAKDESTRHAPSTVQVQTNEARKSEPKASLLRGRGEIAKAHPIPGTMAYKSQMSAEQAEDRLKDIFLKVKAGELPPVLVK